MGAGEKLGRKFEDLMNAVTYAEAGCPEEARRAMRTEKVLLVVTGAEPDERSFRYALNSARRVGAAVEVMFMCEDERAAVPEFMSSGLKEGEVEVFRVKRRGCPREKVLEYIGQRGDILYVVADSDNVLGAGCADGKALKGFWRRLKCPLVLVSEPQAT